jgi:AcrR family transcriptional regulator
MTNRFDKLPSADQKIILNAARDEFSRKGYLLASTNVIVKDAGIPKGTLFYFFGNKKGLFLYLLDQAVSEYGKFVEENTAELSSDIFERLFYMVEIRLRFAAAKPHLYKFLTKALLNIPEELSEEMTKRFKTYSTGNRALMEKGLDTSRLRTGVTLQQVLDLISIVQEGMLHRYTETLAKMPAQKTPDYIKSLLEDSRTQFELIKKGVYRD